MGAVKKTLGSKLLSCGGWLREKEESRARLWRSIHLGGCDNEFALNLKVELWSRQLIRSSDPLSREWSLGVLKAHRITSPSGSAPAIFGQPLSHTTASLFQHSFHQTKPPILNVHLLLLSFRKGQRPTQACSQLEEAYCSGLQTFCLKSPVKGFCKTIYPLTHF